MTACSGRQTGHQPLDHEAKHVALVIRAPWAGGPVQVLVEHECDQWGCTMRGVPVTEPARDVEEVLLKVLNRIPGVTATKGQSA